MAGTAERTGRKPLPAKRPRRRPCCPRSRAHSSVTRPGVRHGVFLTGVSLTSVGHPGLHLKLSSPATQIRAPCRQRPPARWHARDGRRTPVAYRDRPKPAASPGATLSRWHCAFCGFGQRENDVSPPFSATQTVSGPRNPLRSASSPPPPAAADIGAFSSVTELAPGSSGRRKGFRFRFITHGNKPQTSRAVPSVLIRVPSVVARVFV